MSISSEIERIQTAKSAIITSIENKGVTVPTGAKIDELSELIDSIPSGGGGGNIPEGFEIKTAIEYTKYNNVSFNGAPADLYINADDTLEMLVYINYSRGIFGGDFFTTNSYRALSMHYFYDAQQFRCNGNPTIGLGQITKSEYALLKQTNTNFYYNNSSGTCSQNGARINNMMSLNGNDGQIGSSFLWLKITNSDGIVTHNVVPASYNNGIYVLDLITGNYKEINNESNVWKIV